MCNGTFGTSHVFIDKHVATMMIESKVELGDLSAVDIHLQKALLQCKENIKGHASNVSITS